MVTSQDQGPVQLSMDRMRAEMERLIDMARERGGKALDAVGIKNPPRAEFPVIDLTETNDSLHLVADLPGVDPELLDLNVTGQMLRCAAPSPRPPLAKAARCIAVSDTSARSNERSSSPAPSMPTPPTPT